MANGITRRDFLNGTLLGAGASLLNLPSPATLYAGQPFSVDPWDGYGGVGDYATSHGNSASVLLAAHKIRDGEFDRVPADLIDTGETFDLVIVGSGMSGLGAAYYFQKGKKNASCLILDNHPVFGGEAKQNEFVVGGRRLMGPQGSNEFYIPINPANNAYDFYRDLGIPTQFSYQSWDSNLGELEFDRTNYGFHVWSDAPSFGHFFRSRERDSEAGWVKDIWSNYFRESPFSKKAQLDLLAWRNGTRRWEEREDLGPWLDSMTYKEFLEKYMGFDPAVVRYADPILAAAIGLGCDAISAYGAYQIEMPGFQAFTRNYQTPPRPSELPPHVSNMFPGGNSGLARYFIKRLIPGSIRGTRSLEDVLTERINFDALDRATNNVRLRLNSTAVRVEHSSAANKAEHVNIIYTQKGKAYCVKARGVIMAGGGWSTRRVVRDLPNEHRKAYSQFHYSPMLVVNVAVTNWRFLYKLGLTAARWFEGFGFSCNLRRQMTFGKYQPKLHPDHPNILTFYVPFYYPGLGIGKQGARGRAELLSTSFAGYEKHILEQMVRLFGKVGFDPKKDIAGIILNRWGHAFVNPQPSFYFSRDGTPSPSDVIRRRYGRIAFAHSDLGGHQFWRGAVKEGRRAAEQILEIL